FILSRLGMVVIYSTSHSASSSRRSCNRRNSRALARMKRRDTLDRASPKASGTASAADDAGRLVAADNATAHVQRTYLPNGAVLADTLRIGTWAMDGDFSHHIFPLAYADARYYYRGDGLLAAVDHRVCSFQSLETRCLQDSVRLAGAFEDYRYDALGRRVMVRTRTENVCEGSTCHSALMWAP